MELCIWAFKVAVCSASPRAHFYLHFESNAILFMRLYGILNLFLRKLMTFKILLKMNFLIVL
jgi:hypothetical protein